MSSSTSTLSSSTTSGDFSHESLYDLSSIEFIYPKYKELEIMLSNIERYEKKSEKETEKETEKDTKNNYFLPFMRFYTKYKETYNAISKSYTSNYYAKYLLCVFIYKRNCPHFLQKIEYLYKKMQVEPFDKYNIYNLYTEYIDFFDADEFTFWEILHTVSNIEDNYSYNNYSFYMFSNSYLFFKTLELSVKLVYFLTENNDTYQQELYCDSCVDFNKRIDFLYKKKCVFIQELFEDSYEFVPRNLFNNEQWHTMIKVDIKYYLEQHHYNFEKDKLNLNQFIIHKEFSQVENFKKIIKEEIYVLNSLYKINHILKKIKSINILGFTETQKEIISELIELLTIFSQLLDF